MRDAIGRGELPAERYASYEKLKRELHRLEIRLDKRARSEEARRRRASYREIKARTKTSRKR